jgi:hypothetical protein
VTDQHGFNAVGGQESIEIAASARHRYAMPKFNLRAGQIDSSMNMSVHAIRVIQ